MRKTSRRGVPASLPAFRTLFARNPLPMWVFDRKTLEFLEVNQAAVRKYGYSRREFLGMRITDIRPADDVPQLLTTVQRARAAWQYSGTWRHRLRSGRIIDVEITSHTLRFAGRAAILVVAVDVTARKHAESALAERNRVNEQRADIGAILNGAAPLRSCLDECAQVLVRHLPVGAACIWTLDDTGQVLELQGCAGTSGELPPNRIPVAHDTVARLGRERSASLGAIIGSDPCVGDGQWARREGMAAFARCPMRIGGHLIGVVALFAGQRLSSETTTALAAVAAHLALGIDRHRSDERNRMLAAIVEGSDDAIVSTTLDAKISSWNGGAERLYGFSAREALGQPISLIVPPDRLDELRVIRDRVIRGERVRHHETARRRKDGSLIPSSLTLSPVRGESGAVTQLSGVIRDLSERRQAERALFEMQDRMRFVLESCRIGIWDVDAPARRGQWSETMEALHGLPPGTFGGTLEAFLACVHPDDRPTVRATVARMMQERTDSHFLYRTVWPDGTLHWIRATGRSAFDDAGRLVRTAGVSFDVTEFRTLQERYHQAQKMEAVGQLAGGVAHDFNNLLTAILGYAQLGLDQPAIDPPVRDSLEEIQKAGESAASLTRQLLAFSRRQLLRPRTLDLNTIVARLESLLRRLIGEDVVLLCRPEPSVVPVNADAGQIEQIIMNLALNGRDAMPRGGSLIIETAIVELSAASAAACQAPAPGSYAVLTVADTGVGMDEATRARIFEPFFTTKRRTEGTGLGLATVYGIVTQSGGVVCVDSEPGRGTTFKVYLPKAAGEIERAVEEAAPLADLQGKETILVVEDQTAVRAVARAALRRRGYVVLEAGDGETALRIVANHPTPIHLVVTDVVMPAMGGAELGARLRRTYPEIRVLYMSGYTDDSMVRQGVLARGAAFLQKPFTPHILVKKVRDVLDSPPAGDVGASAWVNPNEV